MRRGSHKVNYGSCPRCGSPRVIKTSIAYDGHKDGTITKTQRYRCLDCGYKTRYPIEG